MCLFHLRCLVRQAARDEHVYPEPAEGNRERPVLSLGKLGTSYAQDERGKLQPPFMKRLAGSTRGRVVRSGTPRYNGTITAEEVHMSGSGFPYAQYFGDINMLADMQVPRQDRVWLSGVPRDPEPHQVVLWLGCNILRTTHLVQTVADVFRLLGVDFVTVAGMAYCCGYPYHRHGDLAPSEALSDASVRRMAAFRPETLVIWCPSCFYFYDEVLARRHSFPFALVHVTEFLAGHLDRLFPLFKGNTHHRVALHAHTGTPQRDRDARYGRILLEAVPDVEVVDVMQEPELGRHCTDEVSSTIGTQRYRELLGDTVNRAMGRRADTLATLYHTCQRELCRYERGLSLLVENYITLLGRAMGIEYPDKYKEYTLLGDQEAILADAVPCLQLNGVDPERARGTIQRTFLGEGGARRRPQMVAPASPEG